MTDDRTAADLAEQNEALRNQLIEENTRLQEALARSAASGLTAQGLTDEDVRRLESPQEFEISNAELAARLAELESAGQRVEQRPGPVAAVGLTENPNEVATREGLAGVPNDPQEEVPEDPQQPGAGDVPEFSLNDDGSYTRTADGVRGSFGPTGFTPAA